MKQCAACFPAGVWVAAALVGALGCSARSPSGTSGTGGEGPQPAAGVDADTPQDGGSAAVETGAMADGSSVDAADAGQGAADATGNAVDAGPGATLWATPVLPAFDAATLAHVRQVHAAGVAKGNSDTVFAKVGDSITSSQSFAVDCGNGLYTLDKYAALKTTIEAIRTVNFIDNSNPFNHESLCGQSGMTTLDALKPPSPVTTELQNIHPAFAIVMYGTDDMDIMGVDSFKANMLKVLDLIEAEGTIPAISTIPEHPYYVNGDVLIPAFNDAIRSIAATRQIPFIDFHLALAPLPNQGISDDDVHPSVEPLGDGGVNSCDLTPAGLAYGYNVRNLLALQMLDRLRAL